LNAGLLGQFNLPVTITPASNKIFFIDPTNGDDTFEGTAAEPWKFVKNVLDGTQATGGTVFRTARAGNDVVVTILAGGTETGIASNISTPNLPAGSVTVLKAPSAGTFELDMGTKQLTLNKGYKLQDINIISAFSSSASPPDPAVSITHPTAGLASVDVRCTATSNKVICVEVKGSGSHILKGVKVDVTDANANNIGILSDANTTLSIVGGEVRLTGNANGITLIKSNGVLTVTGLTVDMTGGGSHTQGSKGIVLNKAGSSVTDSTIKVNNGPGSGTNAIGIDIQHTTGTSTVARNNFIGSGTNTVGIKGSSKLSPDSISNNFSGIGTPFQ
jgi:hypothetical protein